MHYKARHGSAYVVLLTHNVSSRAARHWQFVQDHSNKADASATADCHFHYVIVVTLADLS